MAERPIFIPNIDGQTLYTAKLIRFQWHPGFSFSQKQKNVLELHKKAEECGHFPLLEISTKSNREAGKKLSAFNLPVYTEGIEATVETAYQSSKVFERGGPFKEILSMNSYEAKRFHKNIHYGNITKFIFEDKIFEKDPPTAFYDWLYIKSLFSFRDWAKKLERFHGFSDIEFNPSKSLNCQARSIAIYVSLEKRGLLEKSVRDFEYFRNLKFFNFERVEHKFENTLV